MQPILVSCEAPFKSNLQKNIGPVRVMTPTGPFFLLLNGASHDTEIGCIGSVWAGAKKSIFSFLLCADPLSF